MIKINKVFTSEFVRRYSDFAVEEILFPKINSLIRLAPKAMQLKLGGMFTKRYLKDIVLARPDSFEAVIFNIYSSFPELAERYYYAYFLLAADIPHDAVDIDVVSEEGRQKFDSQLDHIVAELARVASGKEVYLTSHYISLFRSNLSRSKKKAHLNRLINANRGRSQATESIKNLFPAWVNDFEACFDYNRLAGELGQTLTEELEMTVCPYCSIESIQTYSSISIRPDLDHFYPKTKFPFLAISLYNLIPSGAICNQKHKRNHSMLGYMSPHVESIEEDMFRFGFIPDGSIRDTFSLRLHPLSATAQQQNVDLFKLENIYSENEDLRAWYFDTVELGDYLKGQGHDLSLIDFRSPPYRHVIDLARPVTKVSAQKFKIEAINMLFNKKLKIIPQSGS